MSKTEKFEKILNWMNHHEFQNQRELAGETGMSLGTVNALLKDMVQAEYLLKSGKRYYLTERGESYLAVLREGQQNVKLRIEAGTDKVRTAVILAAGDNAAFSCPAGLLRLNGVTVIERILHILIQNGIERICVITGAMEEQYRAYFDKRNITLISNPRYKWTGTMESLSLAADFVGEDFLLVESNQIFEEKAVTALLNQPVPNCILMTVPSGSSDEAYVELGRDRTVFRISKDIRQMNHIDGEMLGISRITLRLFQKMLEYFRDNTNPMLNYEYVLEAIGRLYKIQGVFQDDLAWTVIENQSLYDMAINRIYPRIVKRERLEKENRARETLKHCMKLDDSEIEEVRIGGGMTNTNFFVRVHGQEYILRIPGACTDEMINRKSEQHNSALASAAGINPVNVYFNVDSGVKVTECIHGAVTLNGKTARLEEMIRKTTGILRMLHHSGMKLYGNFSVREEYEKYKRMIAKNGAVWYEGFEEMDRFFYTLQERLQQIGLDRKPCHNDLVPENLVLDINGRMYLIDWEYSGYNDPMWDLASHLLECEFTVDEEELLLQHYFQGKAGAKEQEKILIFKICQDILWSAWTVLKESEGEDFGTYGTDRLMRAKQLREEYQGRYGK
ncbi:phosphocholine cytidylyltransferase/choline kinase family protein [Ruminococcus sp. OA3]|uniref:phosphocholine cytidylyltransferase/choline kinase family protein n=1 Tax=Ruminococcus sp. OA3 TaxID=2914164 RepID=UPI001F06CF66|nr:phosphocholine cytidylyltransferase/choline kinase family protein [Ruminococcus sp. OA3]MCH1982161.1 phosphocholine cytidylyltransferase/choline kinase family protein [Ruminococcus sp. OA3]